MRAGHASRTAEHNALFRALESSLPAERRLFDDPYARAFLTWPLSLVGRLARIPAGRDFAIWFIDRRWPGARSAVAARTRLIDEAIESRLGGALRQFVVLGAGLDSRAYRLPGLADLAVFEVDHPDTQASKRRTLRSVLPEEPRNLRFVACDFERDDLGSVMSAAGWDESLPSFVLWEGVTNYLTEDAVSSTLGWVARAAPGSMLVFTYVHRDILTNPGLFTGADRLAASLAKVGERFRFGIDPEELSAFLERHGLTLESDVGAAEFRAKYLGPAGREIRGHEFYRVALARIEARIR